jgi:isoleucyl-tRNA synthetase
VITKFKDKSPGAELPTVYDAKALEEEVRTFYARIGIRKKISDKLRHKKKVGYVEGPPTLNGTPHVGHIRGRIMKDVWYRQSTLQGKNIVFRGGWDTQGLPVELQAEKELGLTGNKWEDLSKIGEERLVEACKSLVQKYEKAWVEADDLVGLLIDHDLAYKTFKDEYIEREWQYLARAWDRGILGEGFKVVPYCPSCMTSLSQGEVSDSYETLEDPSVYYKVKASDGSHLVIWTTMPFTVVTDELVAAKPDANYVYVPVGDETWVIAAGRLKDLSKELNVVFGPPIKTVKGSELEGLRYSHPLLDLIPGLKKLADEGSVHRVVAEEFVDITTGTGLVHLAPANGEDDYSVAQRRNVPVFVPIDDRVTFTSEAGRFQSLFVRDADQLVSSLLRERGALVHESKIKHEYPVCWRSGHRLVWMARREYFYWVDIIKKELIKAAESVNYFFEPPRNRFVEFVRQSSPWCISRERVWGAPLPVWACTKCKQKVPAFSRKRILALAKDLPDGPNFELHRPWIDRIVFRCPKCGSDAQREPFVLDTWHNSGSAPYSSLTNKEYHTLVPVEFLTEGIDQTRGWAYTLLVLNVIFGRAAIAPYKSFLFMGHVLDEKGRKMSKSLGNTLDGLEILRSESVDLVRFYLTWKNSPVEALNMDMKEMSGRPYQILNTFYHLHIYLLQNGSMDRFDSRVHKLSWARRKRKLALSEFWLLSKLNRAAEKMQAAYKETKYSDVCREFESFIVESISQNYIRMVRNELWSDLEIERARRLAIYAVLGHSLKRMEGLSHPLVPFLSEFLYQNVFAGAQRWKEPLLLVGFPTPEPARSYQAQERAVDLALEVESACNSARTKAKLKRRWPIKAILVLLPADQARSLGKARGLVENLCNTKEVKILTNVSAFPATLSLIPNSSRIGAVYKEKSKSVMRVAPRLSGERAWKSRISGKSIRVKLGSRAHELTQQAYDFVVDSEPEWEVGHKEQVLVAIRSTRDDALIAEGLVRDMARRLQALRKKRGFAPTATLEKASVSGLDPATRDLVLPLSNQLKFLVRVRNVEFVPERTSSGRWEEEELDGRTIYLDVF